MVRKSIETVKEEKKEKEEKEEKKEKAEKKEKKEEEKKEENKEEKEKEERKEEKEKEEEKAGKLFVEGSSVKEGTGVKALKKKTREKPLAGEVVKSEVVKSEVAKSEEEKQTVKERKPRASRSKKKVFVERGKRKRAIARATIKEGTGLLKINNLGINAFTSPIERELILEPFRFVDASKIDVSVNVRGGGRMGQAQAARTAIARALVAYTGDEELRKRFMEFDRSLLVEDPRRVEPKKFKGPKARARFTKSYR